MTLRIECSFEVADVIVLFWVHLVVREDHLLRTNLR